ncbi:hypothetical protein ACFXHA_43035 [Nocardia sp. NPDC059240]|uniref:hypothetical protein n=1 Tax=Nocardia sp. NPDC059240 TaxID=3346786 RepID=UPI0036CDDF27
MSVDGTVAVIDTTTRKITETIPIAQGAGNDTFGSITVDPDSHAVYIVNSKFNSMIVFTP